MGDRFPVEIGADREEIFRARRLIGLELPA